MSKKTTVLMILDGYGLNEKTEHNAVALGKTPVMDRLMKEYPFVQGNASGMAVGLPDGQMGNSEVGHLNMGAGRIVYQELTRITKEIQDGTFFENPALMEAVENSSSHRDAGFPRSMCTVSSTGATRLPHREKALRRSSRQRWQRSASAGSRLSWDATMRWTGTITTTACRRHTRR